MGLEESDLRQFGKAIKRRRKALRMGQKDVALLSACSVDFIVDLESGKPSIKFDKALSVLSTLGLGLNLTSSKRRLSVAEDI